VSSVRRKRRSPADPDPFRTADFTPEWRATVERAQPYSMTSVERLVALIGAVEHVVDAGIPGAFVECGVWRGGSSLAAALTFHRLGDIRDLYLFDTFEGMPEPGPDDVDLHGGHASQWWSAEDQRAAASGQGATLQDVSTLLHAYPHANLYLVPGMVEDTIPAMAPDTISVLRLDTDFYESTKHELTHLWPRLQDRGILIVDDYGHFEGARKAVDEFFAERGERPFLHRVDYTARLVVK
jgi:O-methyltransferase